MASTKNQDKTEKSASDQVLTWRVWLPRKRPVLSIVIALIIIALTTAVALIYRHPFYPLLTAVVLAAAVSGHYVPFRFTLNCEGVTIENIWGRRTKPWDKLKTYWPNGNDGVAVNPSDDRGPLAAVRDLYLYFAGNQDEVLRYLARHLSPVKKSEYV